MIDAELPPRKSSDATLVDNGLVASLREMLDDNETITVRALVRRMGTVGHASTVTRDKWRMARVAEWQAEQTRVRCQIERSDKTSRTNLATQLELQRARVADLEAERNLMCGAMLAMIHAVAEMGGLKIWHLFFERNTAALEQLRRMGALPSADVVPLHTATSNVSRKKVDP